jgi:hypothetical protein
LWYLMWSENFVIDEQYSIISEGVLVVVVLVGMVLVVVAAAVVVVLEKQTLTRLQLICGPRVDLVPGSEGCLFFLSSFLSRKIKLSYDSKLVTIGCDGGCWGYYPDPIRL